jgi:hypothetical protein
MTSRSDLSWLVPLDGAVPAKSFVLEVHTDDPHAYLTEIAGRGNVEDTDDAFLSRVFAPPAGEFWIDRLEPRFWVFHTVGPSVAAVAWLRDRVESRRDTDWMWLPSNHLRYIAPDALSRRVRTEFDGARLVSSDDAARDLKVQLSGSHAERLLDRIAALPDYKSAVSFNSIEVDIDDSDLGQMRESVRRWGAFAAHGEQFTHHAQFVQLVIGRYARLIDAIEALALRFEPLAEMNVGALATHSVSGTAAAVGDPGDDDLGGASFAGMPIGIRFSRPIPDLPAFCEELFSSRAPFRLWGQPTVTEDGASVEAVDLHVGQRLSIELGYDWMRVYLYAGSCGNTVARLISNLQTRFDGALSLTHPGLQEAAGLKPSHALTHWA